MSAQSVVSKQEWLVRYEEDSQTWWAKREGVRVEAASEPELRKALKDHVLAPYGPDATARMRRTWTISVYDAEKDEEDEDAPVFSLFD